MPNKSFACLVPVLFIVTPPWVNHPTASLGWGRIFILAFAYILRKFPSDVRLLSLETKKRLRRHPVIID